MTYYHICDACHNEAELVTADFGIGPYEYWGFHGHDSRVETVTTCCETTWTDRRL